jgi:hypothetical protein
MSDERDAPSRLAHEKVSRGQCTPPDPQLEAMIAEAERMARELEREIRAEEDWVGLHDPAHFAYAVYATATVRRRDNVKRSIAEFRLQLEEAIATFEVTGREMKQAAALANGDHMSAITQQLAAGQATLGSDQAEAVLDSANLTWPSSLLKAQARRCANLKHAEGNRTTAITSLTQPVNLRLCACRRRR